MGRGKRRIEGIIQYCILTIAAFTVILPFILMATNSLMSEREAGRIGYVETDENGENVSYMSLNLIPETVTGEQYYKVMFRSPYYLLLFWNSVIITAPIILGQIFLASMAGYGFAKLRFPGRDIIFFGFIIIMLLPQQVVLVPNYIALRELNLLGSYSAIILPGIFTVFGVFLLRQFMRSIPDEYSEAATIDGAGYFRTFTNVILPQVKGGIASMAILVFIDNWNMVEQPLLFLKDKSKFPLSIYMAEINTGAAGIAFACGIIYMLPAVLVFLYGENYLVKGIQLSGIK